MCCRDGITRVTGRTFSPSIQVSMASGRVRIPWAQTSKADTSHPAALAQMSTDTLSQLLKMLTSVLGTWRGRRQQTRHAPPAARQQGHKPPRRAPSVTAWPAPRTPALSLGCREEALRDRFRRRRGDGLAAPPRCRWRAIASPYLDLFAYPEKKGGFAT